MRTSHLVYWYWYAILLVFYSFFNSNIKESKTWFNHNFNDNIGIQCIVFNIDIHKWLSGGACLHNKGVKYLFYVNNSLKCFISDSLVISCLMTKNGTHSSKCSFGSHGHTAQSILQDSYSGSLLQKTNRNKLKKY